MGAFFHFRQNNSGGSFDIDERSGIGEHVIIEANSTDDANDKAEHIGIYFNGCDDGRDCSCCGDRWSPLWKDEEGDESPKLYGKSPEDYDSWGDSRLFVHYLDGTFKEIKLSPKKYK